MEEERLTRRDFLKTAGIFIAGGVFWEIVRRNTNLFGAVKAPQEVDTGKEPNTLPLEDQLIVDGLNINPVNLQSLPDNDSWEALIATASQLEYTGSESVDMLTLQGKNYIQPSNTGEPGEFFQFGKDSLFTIQAPFLYFEVEDLNDGGLQVLGLSQVRITIQNTEKTTFVTNVRPVVLTLTGTPDSLLLVYSFGRSVEIFKTPRGHGFDFNLGDSFNPRIEILLPPIEIGAVREKLQGQTSIWPVLFDLYGYESEDLYPFAITAYNLVGLIEPVPDKQMPDDNGAGVTEV